MNWNNCMTFKGYRNDLSLSLENATQLNCCHYYASFDVNYKINYCKKIKEIHIPKPIYILITQALTLSGESI